MQHKRLVSESDGLSRLEKKLEPRFERELALPAIVIYMFAFDLFKHQVRLAIEGHADVK